MRMRATRSSSTRGNKVEDKSILIETRLMEAEKRIRFLVIENAMTRNDNSASAFSSPLDAVPCLHAGYRCCAACAFAHLSTSFPNWRRRKACTRDNNVCRVMISHGKCLVNPKLLPSTHNSFSGPPARQDGRGSKRGHPAPRQG
jgi:hypothetical protein